MTTEPYETIHMPSHGISWHTTADGMKAHVTKGGKVLKRFKGETAHMDAQRHAYDMWVQHEHGSGN